MSNGILKGSIVGKSDSSKRKVWGDKKSGIFFETITDTARITVNVHKNGDTFINVKSLNSGCLPTINVNGKDAINRLHR